jgi:hypothetical protein
LACAPTLIIFWVIANDWVMANDLDDFDGAKGDPQPAQGRELVIVDLRHVTIMPPRWPEHRAVALASPSADSTRLMLLRPQV